LNEVLVCVVVAIKSMFVGKSRMRVTNLSVRLANNKEGKTTPQYFAAVKAISDELAAAGCPMEEDYRWPYLIHVPIH
jgi:hypothetical protein